MNFDSIMIEISVASLGVFVLLLGVILPQSKKTIVGYISAAALVGILIFSFFYKVADGTSFFGGLYLTDGLSTFFKQVFLIAAILVTLMSIGYVKTLTDSKTEFFALMLFAVVGMMVMTSANDLITLYIGLELMSLAFIILTAYDKKNIKSVEAGTKYILLSAMSTAVILYGMSLLYGLSGSVAFNEVIEYLKTGNNQVAVVVGGILLLSGFSFKIAAAPFHMWSPDIYEGAPAPVTAFLVGGSKVAAFAVIIKLLMKVMQPAYSLISVVVIALAILSMVLGNVIAIPQTNIKRMLAYSSIAHAGYVLLGIVAYTTFGINAMLYYLLLYAFANIGAFAAVTAFSNQTGKEEIKDFAGMWKRSPFIAATLVVSLLSLAGIPPAAGFIGKFYLFSEAVKQGYLWLAFVAMGMSVVSIYYYIMVIRTMLMDAPVEDTKIKIPGTLAIVMAIAIIAIIVMGVYPGPITEWTSAVAATFMK